MLVSAMQACGAIFLKTQVSLAFVQRTLDHLGDNLIAEFVSSFSTTHIMRPLRTQSGNFCSLNPMLPSKTGSR